MQETRVVLGLEDPALQEEVLHFLDRLPRVRVVGATPDAAGLGRELRVARPDAAVVSPRILEEASGLDGATLFVVSPRETTEALRVALRAGARGFYLWPEEREVLARHSDRAGRSLPTDPGKPGRVVSVYGPRGGTGVTFLATNLAAACADRDARVALVDLDPSYGDVASALGVTADGSVGSLSDLAPVLDELTPEHLDRTLFSHSRGFRTLLAPPEPGEPMPAPGVAAVARLLRSSFDMVLLHLPRALDEATRAAVEESDRILVVVNLDVLGLRHAKRALALFGALGVREFCRLVINRAARGEVVPEDAERVLGLSPEVVIRYDRQVGRAQNRGELVAGRSGPVARAIAALARRLLEEETS
jgi:pilus assembly protein CpaE